MSRIKNPSIEWRDNDVPYSNGFGDVYYNLKDGLKETGIVFLEGNRLPGNWTGKRQFTIAETGFGTGLNFLAAWKLFEETAGPDQRLDFISAEQFPLHKDDLRRALTGWRDRIGARYIDRLFACYPLRIPGFHRVWINDRVTLTLVFDDALRAYSQMDCTVDAWFLDGFAPKKNPEIWQQQLLAEIARLSVNGTTLASFTAAGDVRRGLKQCGFDIKRVDGFGYKYHRIIGEFKSDKKRTEIKPPAVQIAGAGLAGLAMAHALQRRGINTTIFEKEKQLGIGASGNRLGLINPKIEAQDNPRNDVGLSAYGFIHHVLADIPGIDYNQTGSLHLAIGDKTERLKKLPAQQGWLEPHMMWIDDAQYFCGIDLKQEGLFYNDAATVNNRKLLEQLAVGKDIRFNATAPGELTIDCTGRDLINTTQLPLQPVRGQVTYIKAPMMLKCPVMFGSYIAPMDGLWAVGATFQQNNDSPDIKDEDDQANIAALKSVIGEHDIEIAGHWANVRTASRDRFPIMGRLDENTLILGALGSHGIQFSFLLAEVLACQLTGAPLPLGRDAVQALSIDRFRKP